MVDGITDRANIALRRCKTDGKQWTAKDVLNPETVNELVKLDEGYSRNVSRPLN
jgi:hypothetical protein